MLGHGDVAGVDAQVARRPQGLDHSPLRVDPMHTRLPGGRARDDQHHAVRGGAHRGHPRERRVQLGDRAVGIAPGEPVVPAAQAGEHDRPVGQHRVARRRELPVRHPDLGVHAHDGCDVGAGRVAVEIPPVAAVGHEPQRAVGAPPRLQHRLVGAARDHELLAAGEVAHHELGGVPRHRRVVPPQPRQRAAVRGQARCGDEVRVADQHLRLAGRVRVEPDDLVHDLGGRRPVVALAHADDRRAVGGEVAVGEAVGARARGLGGERHGVGAVREPVEALVGPVGEPDDAAAGPPAAPAVLVDGGARVPALGKQVGASAVGAAAHELGAPAFRGPALGPEHVVAVEDELAQPHGARHHRRGRERGGPRSVGRGRHIRER